MITSFFLQLMAFPVAWLGWGLALDKSDASVCAEEEVVSSFSESCQRSYLNGDVHTFTLYDGGQEIGNTIWVSRASERAKAKYFAHRQSGSVVFDRYKSWRPGKDVFIMSSGAYATGWNGEDLPAGITVDNGEIVNRSYETRMDGLVIIYATGGIAVSNIEDGDLYLASLNRRVDVKKASDRSLFLNWAVSEDATVFQTHLLAYKNQLQFVSRRNNRTAVRKFLVLAQSAGGELFHIIFYTKHGGYSLYDGAYKTLSYLKGKSMNVIAMINLDTGGYDIIGTGEDVRDCNGDYFSGHSSDKDDMTNLLAYQYE